MVDRLSEYGVRLGEDPAPQPSARRLNLMLFGDSIDRLDLCHCLRPQPLPVSSYEIPPTGGLTAARSSDPSPCPTAQVHA